MDLSGCVVTPRHRSRYRVYTTEGQRPKDSVNPVPTEHGGMQPTCTIALGYGKHMTTNFEWIVHLLPPKRWDYEICSSRIEQSDWTV